MRIGFFDWYEKQNAALFGGGSEGKEGAPSDGGLMVRAVGAGARVGVEGGGVPAAGRGRTCAQFCLGVLCLKCGEGSLHWAVDTTAGLALGALFAVASASLLGPRSSD